MEITRLNSSRIERLVTAKTKKEACHMGLWDKFKDLFVVDSEKKSTQLKQLFNQIKNRDKPVERFLKLASLARPSELHHFQIYLCISSKHVEGERETIQTFDVATETRVDLRIRDESITSVVVINSATYGYMMKHLLPVCKPDGGKVIYSSSSSSPEESSMFSIKRLWTVWNMNQESLDEELADDLISDMIDLSDRLLSSDSEKRSTVEYQSGSPKQEIYTRQWI